MNKAIRKCQAFRSSVKFKKILTQELFKRLKKSTAIFEDYANSNSGGNKVSYKIGNKFDKDTLNQIDKFTSERIKENLNSYTDKPRFYYNKLNYKKKNDLSSDIINSYCSDRSYRSKKKKIQKVY